MKKPKILGISVLVGLIVAIAFGVLIYQQQVHSAKNAIEIQAIEHQWAKNQATELLEEEVRKATEVAKREYSNMYFTLTFPEEWTGHWSVSEESKEINGINIPTYWVGVRFPSVNGRPGGGGGEQIAVIPPGMSWPGEVYENFGSTTSGHTVLVIEGAGGGVFGYAGAKVTLK